MSELDIPYVYEMEYTIDDYGQSNDIVWNTKQTVPWLTHEAVAAIHIYRNNERPMSTRRVVFEFETSNDRARFLDSDVHEAFIDALRWMSNECNTSRWERSAITLGESRTIDPSMSTADGRLGLAYYDNRSVTNGNDSERPDGY